VYSIGVGSKGTANFPERILPTGDTLYSQKPVEIDEQLLKNIALKTRGKYFRATDNDKLNKIYNEINQLEKTKIEDFSPTSYIEEFRNLVVLAMLLLLGYFALDKTLFKGIV
jgi:Ca-activated chloride channel family protein